MTKRAPQRQSKSKARETTVAVKLTTQTASDKYVQAKKHNDDIEDAIIRQRAQLLSLPSEKEMRKIRRSLLMLEKQKFFAHKRMSDAWQEVCGYGADYRTGSTVGGGRRC